MRTLSCASACLLSVAIAAAAQTIELVNVRLIDGTGRAAVEHATIQIRDGKIAGISTAQTSQPPRQTVIPGLINAHGHIGLVKDASVSPENYTGLNVMHQLTQYERYGITTTVSLGLNKDLLYKMRADQGKGNEPGATVLTAGRGIGVPEGMPPVKVGNDQVYRPKNANEARAAVREMAGRSPNLIKIWVDDSLGKLPKMTAEVYEAVIDEAHRANLKVAAHVYYLEDATRLAQAGVDILAHGVRDRELDTETVSLLKSKNIYYIPTLQLEESFYVYGGHPDWMNGPFFQNAVGPKQVDLLNAEAKATGLEVHRRAFQIGMTNARKLHTATVAVGMGTDSGANPYRIQGFAEHRELELLVQAGFTPLEAIHAATQVNAKMLGIEDKTGTIAKGKDADLVVLNANPLENIRNTRQIAAVYHRGRKVELSPAK